MKLKDGSDIFLAIIMAFFMGASLITLFGISCETRSVFTYTYSTKVDLVKKGHAEWISNKDGKPEWKLKETN